MSKACALQSFLHISAQKQIWQMSRYNARIIPNIRIQMPRIRFKFMVKYAYMNGSTSSRKSDGMCFLLKIMGRKGKNAYFFRLSSTATATETVIPTMGLLPAPRKPIISTWAGTEEEPANWASECIRPMVSVMP